MPVLSRVLPADSLQWNASPETSLSWRELPHPSLLASQGQLTTNDPGIRTCKCPATLPQVRATLKGHSTSRTPPDSVKGLVTTASQFKFSFSLVLLPSLPPWYYQGHSPINFWRQISISESASSVTQPKIFFHCSSLVILSLLHQNWFFYLNHNYVFFLNIIII